MKSKESKQRSVREIEFDANLLLQSLRGHADHLEGKKKLTLRFTKLTLPELVSSDLTEANEGHEGREA